MDTAVRPLTFARVKDPRDCWPYVKQGLLRILEIAPEEPWGPEDVFHAIRTGKVALYLVNDGPSVIGFFGLEVIEQEFSHKPMLQVWFLYGNGLQHQDEVLSCLDQIAKDCKIERIRWKGRRGWERALKGKFESVYVVYERVVK